MKTFLKTIAMMGLVMACATLRIAAQATPVEGTVDATGKLVKVMAVGAETTGWAIEFDAGSKFPAGTACTRLRWKAT